MKEMTIMNSLDNIFSAMRSGRYGCVIDTKGKAHTGIINNIMREDGSGKNWIVTLSISTVGVFGAFNCNEKVFIHAQ